MTCQACTQEAASRLPRGVYLHHTCPPADRLALPLVWLLSHPLAFAALIFGGLATAVVTAWRWSA